MADRDARVAAELETASTLRFLEGEIAQLEAMLRAEQARAAELFEAAGSEQARLDAEVAGLQAERSRLAEELARKSEAIEARDRDLIASARQLRPYRLIDRFGLVGSIYRRFRPFKRFLPVQAGGGLRARSMRGRPG